MVRSAATPRVSNHQARCVPDCGSIKLKNALEAASVKSAPSPLIVVPDAEPGAIAGLSGDGFR